GAFSVFATDVDRDGDTDVLSASLSNDTVAWYANDGEQNFTEFTISTSTDGARSVFAADVDGDGDTDVLSASLWDNKIALHQNDGQQNFIEYTISTNAEGAQSVFAADVDGDGDLDVLSASERDNTIAWYENLAAPHITDASASARGVQIALSEPTQFGPSTLYSGQATDGAVGVTLAGNMSGPAAGSLIWDEVEQELVFLTTGPALVPDQYTLVLRSDPSGVVGANGLALDGDGDGKPGGDYTYSFEIQANDNRLLSLPDFARGSGQVVDLGETGGIPISVDDAEGVEQLQFTLFYDPETLNIDEAVLGAALGEDWTINLDTSTPGEAVVSLFGGAALGAG
ncbi:MAG: VCBS repeat-containing protein, partial [Planctomycetales bacterium]|nr:VCBS repeat-containing protein [Planctomycetales bacterium]